MSRYSVLTLLLSGLVVMFISACSKVDNEPDSRLAVVHDNIFSDSADYIVVLGDLQTMTYSQEYISYLDATARWIDINAGNISCVLQVGDVTETNNPREWQAMNEACAVFSSDVPYFVTVGNHDYDWMLTSDNYSGISDRNSTLINRYQPAPAARKNLVEVYEPGHIENAVYRIPIAGRQLYLLVLEFAPRLEVIEWADKYVKSHPDDKFILMTHEFLNADGSLVYRKWSHAYFQFEWTGSNYLAPNELLESFIVPNPNLRAVVCGHNGFCRHRSTTTTSGYDVTQIMFNLQYQTNGGDGMVMIWKIPHDSDSVEVSVYNVLTGLFTSDPETSFSFQIY